MKSRKHLLHRSWICPNIFWGCFLVFFISSTISVLAQEDKKAIKKAEHAHAKAQKANKKGEFYEAEAEFRKAISGNPDQMDSRYNLGSTYYDQGQYKESLMRFEEAAKLAENKAAKHAAYHNLGNSLMKNNEYRKAEQAFKEALRNDPTDEETRYNYAIAKELAKDEPEPPSDESDVPEDTPDQEDQEEDDEQQDPEQNEGDEQEGAKDEQ